MDIENEIEKRRPPAPARASAPAPRAPMRPEPSVDEDPRERAARRAAEVRLHNNGNMDEGIDEFRAPQAPDGWTYEWKNKTVVGMEMHSYQVELYRKGWEPVPTSRHPEMMPIESKSATIERKGMVLMERPTELVDEAKSIERRKAIGQVRAKEAQLAGTPEGGLGHRDHAQVQPKISKGYEPMPIPDK